MRAAIDIRGRVCAPRGEQSWDGARTAAAASVLMSKATSLFGRWGNKAAATETNATAPPQILRVQISSGSRSSRSRGLGDAVVVSRLLHCVPQSRFGTPSQLQHLHTTPTSIGRLDTCHNVRPQLCRRGPIRAWLHPRRHIRAPS